MHGEVEGAQAPYDSDATAAAAVLLELLQSKLAVQHEAGGLPAGCPGVGDKL